jgi:hypothetical protein
MERVLLKVAPDTFKDILERVLAANQGDRLHKVGIQHGAVPMRVDAIDLSDVGIIIDPEA